MLCPSDSAHRFLALSALAGGTEAVLRVFAFIAGSGVQTADAAVMAPPHREPNAMHDCRPASGQLDDTSEYHTPPSSPRNARLSTDAGTSCANNALKGSSAARVEGQTPNSAAATSSTSLYPLLDAAVPLGIEHHGPRPNRSRGCSSRNGGDEGPPLATWGGAQAALDLPMGHPVWNGAWAPTPNGSVFSLDFSDLIAELNAELELSDDDDL
jgi:hypothetical protein